MNSKTIIYIIGAGRSGTTLLDIIIGNEENIESCGELNRYTKRKGEPPLYSKHTEQAQFWSKVYNQLSIDENEFDDLEHINNKLEYHKGFLQSIFKIQKKEELELYEKFQKKLFQSIFNNLPNNKNIIIDSSKYAGRAVMLSKTLPYKILYIYIKRDPVSVVSSFSKKDVEQPSKGWIAANMYYAAINILCYWAIKKLSKKHKVITVTYEDMVNKPIQMLAELQNTLDVNLSGVSKKIEKKIPLTIGKLFDGNRIRLKKEIFIQSSKKVELKNIKDYIVRYIHFFLYKP